jgi:hypothetical protein
VVAWRIIEPTHRAARSASSSRRSSSSATGAILANRAVDAALLSGMRHPRPDAGDKVFVAILERGRPRGSQADVEGRWWVVMTLGGGELARAEVFPERAQALEAARLRESGDVAGER